MDIVEIEKLLGQTVDTLKMQAEKVATGLVHLMATLQTLQQAHCILAKAELNVTGPDPVQEAADENLQQERYAVQELVNQCQELAHQLGQLVTKVVPQNLHSICQVASLPPHTAWVDAPAYTLSLKEVASWQLRHLAQGKPPPIIAALPSLQRGAVWRPNQVELLWDSILRGFPIGALVVSRQLDSQESHSGSVAGKHLVWNKSEITHHLLDGQQRCNAIALGFHDPFPPSQNASGNTPILWLDLEPNPKRFAGNSSRSFFARVCTVAHPWGYGVDDNAGRLGTADIREGIESDYRWWPKGPNDPNYKRPSTVDIWPLAADVPVPMAWLLHAAEATDNAVDLWQSVRNRCQCHFDSLPLDEIAKWKVSEENSRHWTQRAITRLAQPPDQTLIDLRNALFRVRTGRLVALNVTDLSLHQPTRQELVSLASPVDPEQRIANVEHLFQRLNSLGTELRGDELLYSMVKAYWPGIEQTIEAITPRPPATQVALLGARLALSDLSVPKAAPGLSVAALRAIAQSKETSGDSKLIIERRKAKDEIDQLFALNKYAVSIPGRSAPIEDVIRRVDEWLLYDLVANPNGLPPVLRARMAEQTPEVFHFLMSLAKVSLDNNLKPTPNALTRLRGLTTALHWFGQDRGAAVTELWKMGPLPGWLDEGVYLQHPQVLQELKSIGQGSDQKIGLVNLLKPVDLESLIMAPTPTKVEDWHWWNTLIRDPATDAQGKLSEDEQTRRQIAHWPMLERLTGEKGDADKYLLIFGQRDFMHRGFPYDPSITGYWEDHNRPWDYDHILPQSLFTNLKRKNPVTGNTFLWVCQQWGRTIGNLHILPFEQNRSRQDELAINSLPGDAAFLSSALLDDSSRIPPGDLRTTFSIEVEHVTDSGHDPIVNRQKVYDFVTAARTRLLRIYTDWFDSMNIGSML